MASNATPGSRSSPPVESHFWPQTGRHSRPCATNASPPCDRRRWRSSKFRAMMPWLLAALVGFALAAVQYGPSGTRRELPAALLRAVGITLLVALLLDAPAGAARAVRLLAALDVSASWQRGG